MRRLHCLCNVEKPQLSTSEERGRGDVGGGGGGLGYSTTWLDRNSLLNIYKKREKKTVWTGQVVLVKEG